MFTIFAFCGVLCLLALILNDLWRFEIEYGLLLAAVFAIGAINITTGISLNAMALNAAAFAVVVGIIIFFLKSPLGQGDWALIPATGAMLGLDNILVFYTGFIAALLGYLLYSWLRGADLRKAPIPAALPLGFATLCAVAPRLLQAQNIYPTLETIAITGIIAGFCWTAYDLVMHTPRLINKGP